MSDSDEILGRGESPPVVLCLSGHDPTGGAGVQADIEALRRTGCHPATVVTALTAQDTRDVRRVLPQNPDDFLEQARLLLDDMPVVAIKIGLLGSAAIAEAVDQLLGAAPSVPVVLDPILAAGGGHPLAGNELLSSLTRFLLPRVNVLTPNTVEARQLTGQTSPDDCAAALLASGCRHVLLTGTHEDSDQVINRWYGPDGCIESRWTRLQGSYHGSGCTLAATLAGGLARDLPMAEAVSMALRLTWESLREGYAVGRGQLVPRR
jgi:hydroxymethylpyrimidine/phosphomethylpyrimidine kinase